MACARHWLIGALALLEASSAFAALPAPPVPGVHGKRPAAGVLIDKGKAALAAKDAVAARQAFSQAYRATATPEVLFLLGRAAQAEGRILDAHDLMRRYLIDPARAPDDAATAEAQQVVKQTRPASGQIVVLGAAGSLISVDDRLVGSVPLAQPLLAAPGEHRITLELGNRRLESPVIVQAGRSFEVRFTESSGAVLITLLPALLWVTEQVGVAEEAQNPLADAAEQAARAADQTLLATDAALARAPELAACLKTTACKQQLARKNEVEYVLTSQVKRSALAGLDAATVGSWQLQLTLWHADIATPATTQSAECPKCTAEQAALALKQATATLLAKGLHRGHGSYTITTEPANAELRIDGTVVRGSPYKAAVWSGTYELSLRHPGFAPATRTLEIRDGQNEDVAITLEKGATTAQPAEAAKPPQGVARRINWRYPTGGVLIGVGVLMDAFGFAAIGPNGGCVEPSLSPSSPLCSGVYDTSPAVAGLLGVGTAAIAAGVLIMTLPAPHKKK